VDRDAPGGDTLLIGRVARAHGNRGQVIVNLDTDFPDQRFRRGEVVQIGSAAPVARRILDVRFHQGRPILTLEGIETMNDAEALAGAELKIGSWDVAPLTPGTFYHHDLMGCEVKDTSGRIIGTVTDVQGPLERSLLVVGEGRGEVMIPMVEGIVVSVDLGGRAITVDLPDGLADVNGAAE